MPLPSCQVTGHTSLNALRSPVSVFTQTMLPFPLVIPMGCTWARDDTFLSLHEPLSCPRSVLVECSSAVQGSFGVQQRLSLSLADRAVEGRIHPGFLLSLGEGHLSGRCIHAVHSSFSCAISLSGLSLLYLNILICFVLFR